MDEVVKLGHLMPSHHRGVSRLSSSIQSPVSHQGILNVLLQCHHHMMPHSVILLLHNVIKG